MLIWMRFQIKQEQDRYPDPNTQTQRTGLLKEMEQWEVEDN